MGAAFDCGKQRSSVDRPPQRAGPKARPRPRVVQLGEGYPGLAKAAYAVCEQRTKPATRLRIKPVRGARPGIINSLIARPRFHGYEAIVPELTRIKFQVQLPEYARAKTTPRIGGVCRLQLARLIPATPFAPAFCTIGGI